MQIIIILQENDKLQIVNQTHGFLLSGFSEIFIKYFTVYPIEKKDEVL